MRKFEDKQVEVVTRRVCVELKCDLCGSLAEYPNDGQWEWGGVGRSTATLEAHFYIDGDGDYDSVDLCFKCATKLIKMIRNGDGKKLLGE